MANRKSREEVYWVTIAVLSLLVVFCCLLDKWGIRLWGAPIDYTRFGSWSEAVSGIATAVAVIVALMSMASQRTLDRRASEEKEIELETAVYIWLQHKLVNHGQTNGSIPIWDAVIRNAMPYPIYEWKVSISNASINLCNHQFWPLLPGDNFMNVHALDGVDPSKTPDVAITFIGRANRVWIRTTRGQIKATELTALQCDHAAMA